ncbi:MAG: hypothetical protein PF961_21750 [Planctomycetota bacterium]|jgi:hypothetical protein|nr:hypothetical protein [Planctomycetota bacterium]
MKKLIIAGVAILVCGCAVAVYVVSRRPPRIEYAYDAQGDIGALAITTVPEGARVYVARASDPYVVTSGSVRVNVDLNAQPGQSEWELIGTTPLEAYSLICSHHVIVKEHRAVFGDRVLDQRDVPYAYRIKMVKEGFRELVLDDIGINALSETRLDMTLDPEGEISEP